MKRLLFLLLVLALVFSGASCSTGVITETEDLPTVTLTETGDIQIATKKTLNPMTEYPDYSLPAGSSTDELRAMIVKAMEDELTIRWVCPEDITFEKLSRESSSYTLKKDTVYAGLPYTAGFSGLFTFLEYYDPNSGVINASKDIITKQLGNGCTVSVRWAWSAVLSDVTWHNNWQMVVSHGCLPVGPYVYDFSIADLSFVSTQDICADNGEQIMYQSYAAALPADGVVTYSAKVTGDHGMMVIETPHVEYNADGTINGEKSILVVRDQYPTYQVQTRDGETVTSFGHLRREFTFAKLYSLSYIPFTHAELTGEREYKGLEISFLRDDGKPVTSFDDFSKASIRSSHPVITAIATVTDKAGNEVGSIRRISSRDRFVANTAQDYAAAGLPRASAFKGLQKGESYTYHLSALVSTGRTVDLSSFDFTY